MVPLLGLVMPGLVVVLVPPRGLTGVAGVRGLATPGFLLVVPVPVIPEVLGVPVTPEVPVMPEVPVTPEVLGVPVTPEVFALVVPLCPPLAAP